MPGSNSSSSSGSKFVYLFINCNLLSQFAFDLSMSHCAMATNGNLLHNQNDAFNSCVYYALQAGNGADRQARVQANLLYFDPFLWTRMNLYQ